MSYIKSLLEDINAECENENIPVKAFIAYLDNDHIPLGEWQDHIPNFHEAYVGKYDSVADFASDMAERLGVFTEASSYDSFLVRYFDFEAWGRDLLQGDYWEIDGYYFGSY